MFTERMITPWTIARIDAVPNPPSCHLDWRGNSALGRPRTLLRTRPWAAIGSPGRSGQAAPFPFAGATRPANAGEVSPTASDKRVLSTWPRILARSTPRTFPIVSDNPDFDVILI